MDVELIRKLAGNLNEVMPLEIATADTEQGQDAAISQENLSRLRGYVQLALRQQLKPEELGKSRDPLVRSRLRSIVMRALVELDIPIGSGAAAALAEELADDLLGFGPIEQFFYDPEVTEIKVIRYDLIRVEKHGIERVAEGVRFRDEQHCRDILERMLAPTGRRIDISSPRVNARLFDGSRLIAHIPPVAVEGTTITIRRFRQDMTVENLLKRGVLTPEVLEFLKAAVLARMNIVICGGTSSGKTTLLNCIASFIPDEESIITIEDPAELQLQHRNVRRLEAKPPNQEGKGAVTQRDLMVDALRMAPKRIIIGECRAGEAFDMLQAMNTGHLGSMTTIHANSARHGTRRLVNMVQMAELDLPYEAIIEQIADAVDIFIHVLKDRSGRRRLDHIVEVTGVERTPEGVLNVGLNPLWQYDRSAERLVWVASKFTRERIFREEGGWTC